MNATRNLATDEHGSNTDDATIVKVFAETDAAVAEAVLRCSVHQGSALFVLQAVREAVRKECGDATAELCIAHRTEGAKNQGSLEPQIANAICADSAQGEQSAGRPRISAIVRDEPVKESVQPKWGGARV